jgi:hypothetical protein
VGIGYVTGHNGFFHLRPSEASSARIPDQFLIPTVRSGRQLSCDAIDEETVSSWIARDEPCLLLRLRPHEAIPKEIVKYLNTAAGKEASESYKCRNRSPWYVVPDVVIPDGFLTYMSGNGPALVSNEAGCSCSNSVHAVRMKNGYSLTSIRSAWAHPLTQLSAEIEGHPLGGGMLKLEPREANRIILPTGNLRFKSDEIQELEKARSILRLWRHYGE